jgi:hypothetical protein
MMPMANAYSQNVCLVLGGIELKETPIIDNYYLKY